MDAMTRPYDNALVLSASSMRIKPNLSLQHFAGQGPIVIEVVVNNQRVAATIDTGAGASLISAELAAGLRHRPNKTIKLTTISGELLKDDGFAIAPILIGKKEVNYPLLITTTTQCHLLLGFDFLQNYGCILDMKANTLVSETFGKINFKPEENYLRPILFSNIRDKLPVVNMPIRYLRVASTTILPPRSEVMVPIYGENLEEGEEVIIQRRDQIYNKNRVLVPNALINSKTSHILLINPSTERKYLSTNTRIGLLDAEATQAMKNQRSQDQQGLETAISSQELLKKFVISKELSPQIKTRLEDLLLEYADIFQMDGKRLGKTNRFKCKIDTGDAPPIRQRLVPRAEKENKEIEAHIKGLIELGVIEPSESEWACNCFVVPKKADDGSWTARRFICDYRALNLQTKKLSVPLQRIEDVLNRVSKAKYFSTLDLAAGFYQIEMDESSKEKTAFRDRNGLWQFKVMPFGLTNSPPIFAKLMDMVLSGLRYDICMCYLDDIVVFSETAETHISNLRTVFERMRRENLVLKPGKCNFLFTEIKILGYVLNKDGVKLDESQVTAVRNLQEPRTRKQTQKILGLFSYFRKFIPDYSKVAEPMQRLLSHDVKFHWAEEQQQSFNKLKEAITTAPVLALFDPSRETILKTDASSLHGLGAALFQIVEGKERPVAFLSRSLSPAEKNYTTTEIELAAIARALKKVRHLVYGVKSRPTTVVFATF
jgi:hypothetical protein